MLAAAAALASGFGGQAAAQSAAERAVEAAKQYAGTEITIVREAGLPREHEELILSGNAMRLLGEGA